jgi:hypothetical protein
MLLKFLDIMLKKALLEGIIIGIVTTIVYLAVVVITSPSLPPITAIIATFKANSIIISGLAAGIEIQVFISR